MSRFFAPYCRVYFNRASDAPKIWSLDQGPGTPEICATAVRFYAEGITRYQARDGDGSGPEGADLKAPRAWLEFRNVRVSLSNRGAIRISEAA